MEHGRPRAEFQCDICGKVLSRNQRLQTHKLTVHGISPDQEVKRYKQYTLDPNLSIPRTTAYRKRKFQNNEADADHHNNFDETNTNSNTFSNVQDRVNLCTTESTCMLQKQPVQNVNLETGGVYSWEMINAGNNTEIQTMPATETNDLQLHEHEETRSILDHDEHLTKIGDSDHVSETCSLSSEVNSIATSLSSDLSSDSESHEEELDFEISTDSDSSIEINDEAFVSYKESYTFLPNTKHFTEEDEKNMVLLSFLLRHHLGSNGSRDMLQIIKIFNPSYEVQDLNTLKQVVGSTETQLFHFCEKCFTMFPEDDSMFRCSQVGCGGLRYKGPLNKQHLKLKKSYFTCLLLQQQIEDILQRAGVWDAIAKYRLECVQSESITDILNADAYKQLRKPGNFMDNDSNLTLMFNTDGVPLFKSSGVSIWPVYLVINELPPVMRFSRRNMILWGIWQSKGKPVFRTFLQPFIGHMRQLKEEGLSIKIGGKLINPRALLMASTLDLQAKAYLSEMTQHNGKFGCITCEDPGCVVAQGRGHARVYPHRPTNEVNKERTTEEILTCGLAAVDSGKPEIGIKGVSALHGLEWFNVVWGLVPDYMHGVLLGLTKSLLKLWFSSSNSGKAYFIGKEIKQVDKYLKKMKPTDDVPRLPRKIENNIHHFKASELQMWLLFYSIPCLIKVMVPEYLDHLALMIEGIYILLGDKISNEQLDHAECVLDLFYSKFAILYGVNNCTLNLHNIGRHLTDYVRKLGPLWAWSCFPFEDMNGTILESVHGTKDVCFQILWAIQAKKRLIVDSSKMKNPQLKQFVEEATSTKRMIKIKYEAANCKIAGGMKQTIPTENIQEQLKQICADGDIGIISQVTRVVMNNTTFLSKLYTRMTKRIGHVVLLNEHCNYDSLLASVQYFLLHHKTNRCLAVVKFVKIKEEMALIHRTVHHLIAVEPIDGNVQEQAIPVEHIREKLLYLNGNSKHCCVARLPNVYGQSS